MHRTSLLALLALPLAWCIDITGRVTLDPFTNHLLPIGSKVVLDHGAQSTLILQDGSFTLRGVNDGEHLVQPLVPGYTAPATLYTIQNTTIHAQTYYPSKLPLPLTTPSIPLPLTVTPTPENYYTAPQGMNIFGMLKSPMVLMVLFSGILLFAMPKLMSMMEMDPEMARDVAETRKKMQGMQNMDFMGSLSSMLAGEAAGDAKAVAVNPGATASSGGSGNGAKQRRKGR